MKNRFKKFLFIGTLSTIPFIFIPMSSKCKNEEKPKPKEPSKPNPENSLDKELKENLDKIQLKLKGLTPENYQYMYPSEVNDKSLIFENFDKNVYEIIEITKQAENKTGILKVSFKIKRKDNSKTSNIRTIELKGFKIDDYKVEKTTEFEDIVKNKIKFELINSNWKLNKIAPSFVKRDGFSSWFKYKQESGLADIETTIDDSWYKELKIDEEKGTVTIKYSIEVKNHKNKTKYTFENQEITIEGLNKKPTKEKFETFLKEKAILEGTFEGTKIDKQYTFEFLKSVQNDIVMNVLDKEDEFIFPEDYKNNEKFIFDYIKLLNSDYKSKIDLEVSGKVAGWDYELTNFKLENKEFPIQEGRTLKDIIDSENFKFDLKEKKLYPAFKYKQTFENKLKEKLELTIENNNIQQTKDLLSKWGVSIKENSIKIIDVDSKNRKLKVKLTLIKDNTFGEEETEGIEIEKEIENFAEATNMKDQDFEQVLEKLKFNITENSYFEDTAKEGIKQLVKLNFENSEFNKEFLENNLIKQINAEEFDKNVTFTFEEATHSVIAKIKWTNSSNQVKEKEIKLVLKEGSIEKDLDNLLEELKINVPTDKDVWTIQSKDIASQYKLFEEAFTKNPSVFVKTHGKDKNFIIDYEKNPKNKEKYKKSIELAKEGKLPLTFTFVHKDLNLEYKITKTYQGKKHESLDLDKLAKENKIFELDKTNPKYKNELDAIKSFLESNSKGGYIKLENNGTIKYGTSRNKSNTLISFLKINNLITQSGEIKAIIPPIKNNDGSNVDGNRRALFFSKDKDGKVIIRYRISSEQDAIEYIFNLE